MGKKRKYGFDFLKTLSQKIGDLSGFALMCRELIQNADDEECDWIRFRFTPKALVVQNPSAFNDDDFENIRTIGSEGKIKKAEKAGRFGVGFVSVFQICDHPVILSNGIELTIFPENQEADENDYEGIEGTEFFLEWAREKTQVRQGLKKEIITDKDIANFEKNIIDSLHDTMLFLRYVRKIEIDLINGQKIIGKRQPDDGHWRTIQIYRGNEKEGESDWMVFERPKTSIIEIAGVDRSDAIGVVFPLIHNGKEKSDGMVYCTLPTRTPTGLPVSVNADFAIKSDRATLVDEGFSPDVQWNRTLIDRLGELYVDAIMEARDLIEDKHFASMLPPDNYANPACPMLEGIQNKFFHEAQDKPIIKVVRDCSWYKPSDARFLSSEKSPELFQHLSALFAPLVVAPIQKRWNLLSQKLGVKFFTLRDLQKILEDFGIEIGNPIDSIPNELKASGCLDAIWGFIDSELKRVKDDDFLELARTLPLCPCVDGSYRPFSECLIIDGNLLEALPLIKTFYSVVQGEFQEKNPELSIKLCEKGGLNLIPELLSERESTEIISMEHDSQIDLLKLYDYLADNAKELKSNLGLAEEIASLKVFPSGQSSLYRSISDLFLPGEFEDPIGLDIILDTELVEDRHIGVFKTLGLTELKVLGYVKKVAPTYFDNPFQFGPEDHRVELLDVIRRRLPDIESDSEAMEIIRQQKCILCNDEQYHCPSDVYLQSDELIEIFQNYPHPHIQYGYPLNESWQDFFNKLGARKQPAIENIIKEIRNIAARPFDESLKLMEQVFYYLAKRFSDMDDDEKLELSKLKYIEWLPVAGEDEYELPGNLYLWSLSKLVGRQGKILSFSREGAFKGDFREHIGLRERPTVELIINNLRDLKDRGEEPDLFIYRELNNRISEFTDVEKDTLSKQPLLYIDNEVGFVHGFKVFWRSQPFGNYRYVLNEKLREFQKLMQDIIGIKDEVKEKDYLDVLVEIGETDKFHRKVEAEGYNLIRAIYAFLSSKFTSLDDDERKKVEQDWTNTLQQKRVILTRSSQLKNPEICFFADKEWAIRVFEEKIVDLLVDKDPQTWPFLNAIGVRPLSSVVKVLNFTKPIVIQKSPIQDTLHSKERGEALKRIIETHKQTVPRQHWKLDLLLNMEITECNDLEVEFFIAVNGTRIKSGLKHPESHFDSATSNLYVLRNLPDEIKLLETSRKLANVLNAEIDPAVLCSQIRYAINPELSDDDVHKFLTYMGIDEIVEKKITGFDHGQEPGGEAEPIFDGEDSSGAMDGDKEAGDKDEQTTRETDSGRRGNTKPPSDRKTKEKPQGDKVAEERKKYFEKRKQYYADREDFETGDPLTEEQLKDDRKPLTEEEKREHEELAKVFYNRQIRSIERRLYRLQAGEETYDIYSSEWENISKQIRERDDNRCRRCGTSEDELRKVGSHLTVHHIVPRKEGGSNWPSNLITLCIICHREVENAPELL